MDGLDAESSPSARCHNLFVQGNLSSNRYHPHPSGKAGLRSRKTDRRDAEIDRLRRKVGELTMDNELLVELQRIQEERPRPQMRRSKR